MIKMSRRFYFTNENGDNIGNDHIGNIRGAKTAAKRLANELNCEVCINDCETEDMLDFVYPDKTETSVESVEETTISETETVETEITEKLIMRLSDDDGNVLGVKVFVGTYKQADEEAERIMAETGCYVSYVRYTDSRWNWMSRKYYCGTDSESALTIVSPITMKIEQTAETAEQETELNTEVEMEQTENNAESVSETYGVDVKVDTSKTDELSGATKMLMVFRPVVSEYLRQIEYIDTS